MQLNVRKLLGLRKYTNIMLKRGYTQDNDAVELVPQHRQRQPDRRNGTIVLMNEERNAGDALARRERLDQQDRRPRVQRQRQRGRDGVRGTGATRA